MDVSYFIKTNINNVYLPNHPTVVIYSIYDYYLEQSLKNLSEIPFEDQLKECSGLNVVVLDYCGISSKYIHEFGNWDVYLVIDQLEDVTECIINYDVVYVLANESQYISMCRPYLKVIFEKNKLEKVEFYQMKDITEDCQC